MEDKKSSNNEPLMELTPELMESYVNGTLSAPMMLRVENFLAENPFEAEAVEGLRSSSTNFSADLAELKDGLTEKIKPQDNSSFRYFWPAAAMISLLIISGLILYLYVPSPSNHSQIAVVQDSSITTPIEPSTNIESESDQEPEVAVETIVESNERVALKLSQEQSTQTKQSPQKIPVEPETPEQKASTNLSSVTDESYSREKTNPLGAQNKTIIEEQVSESDELALADFANLEKEKSPSAAPAVSRSSRNPAVFPLVTAPEGFERYLEQHLRYPESAKEQGIAGFVKIAFMVNVDGSLSEFRIIRELSNDCDQEAIRILRSGPVWEPAEINETPVRSRGEIEIYFPTEE